MKDIYNIFSDVYEDKYLKKGNYSTLNLPEVSLVGATKLYLEPKYQYRPELLSYDFYGVQEFDDIIMIANKILDPIKDFYPGRIVYLPTYDECIRIMTA
jgi:hypothetical protein